MIICRSPFAQVSQPTTNSPGFFGSSGLDISRFLLSCFPPHEEALFVRRGLIFRSQRVKRFRLPDNRKRRCCRMSCGG